MSNLRRITTWNPFREIEDVLNRYHGNNEWQLSTTKTNDGEMTVADWAPKVDVKENTESYLIKAELPGVDKKDVKVTLEKGVLSIRGEKKFEKESQDDKHHRVECSYGSFVRSFSLPESVQEENVKANFKNGILYLTIPKAAEAKQKSIEINVE